ncbi:hypothetical protein LWI29_001401 [Acer saccharum]|uniref:Uncharacterized protein n=1 Tax=Acer saccharum TaxID=4024 RepID=A0AA39RC32_ACESA|nr:hypothetical protein LWI29_001401 [Acer saccharum]
MSTNRYRKWGMKAPSGNSRRTTVAGGNWRSDQFQNMPTYGEGSSQHTGPVGRQEVIPRGRNMVASGKDKPVPKTSKPIREMNIEGNKEVSAEVIRVANSDMNMDPAFNDQDTGIIIDKEVGRNRIHGQDVSVGPGSVSGMVTKVQPVVMGYIEELGLQVTTDPTKSIIVCQDGVPTVRPLGSENKNDISLRVQIGRKRGAPTAIESAIRRKLVKSDFQREDSQLAVVDVNEGKLENSEAIHNDDSVLDGQKCKKDSTSDAADSVTCSEGSPKAVGNSILAISTGQPAGRS